MVIFPCTCTSPSVRSSNLSTIRATTKLAEQAANGEFSEEDRVEMQRQYNVLAERAESIISSTTFGGRKMFDGGFHGVVQTGNPAVGEQNTSFQIGNVEKLVQGLAKGDLSSGDSSIETVKLLDAMLGEMQQARNDVEAPRSKVESEIRATQSSLELVESQQAQQASAAPLRDFGEAESLANSTRLSILQHGGIAMLAQANQSVQMVMQLVR